MTLKLSNYLADICMKLFVALGPGDIVNAARLRLNGKEISETSIAFSEQLFSYCKTEQIKTLAISAHPRPDRIQDGIISIENQPKLFGGKGGLAFHISALHYACSLALRAYRFGADLAIIDAGTTHYFLLAFFRLFGIRVAVNLHNVLWPVGYPPQKKVHQIIRSLNAFFFRNLAAGAIGVSPECERQVVSESSNRIPFFQYRCQFVTDGFLQAKPYETGTFRIACVGRAEENKGFIDIANIAECLQTRSLVPVEFHICGEGPAIPELKKIIREKNLANSVIIHGRLERAALLKVYARSHAVIIPTKSTFAGGMPQVCAEAVLSGLPVITSPVSNAFDVIGPAIVRVDTDNIQSYVDCIITLITDRKLYRNLQAQCDICSQQFLDRSKRYSAAVISLINTLFPAQV